MGNQVTAVRKGFVAYSTAIDIQTGMGFADMRALIIELREVLPFAIRTFIQRTLAPCSYVAKSIRRN